MGNHRRVPYIAKDARRRDPSPISRVFRAERPRRPSELVARARGRPHAALHERGDGAVQEGVPRSRGAAGRQTPRDDVAEVRARRRQAQRSRAGRAHRTGITRSSRCSGTSRSATTSSATRSASRGSSSPRSWASTRALVRVTVHHKDDEARALWREIAGLSERADLRARRQGQLLADGRHRSLRAVLRDLRRPRAPGEGLGVSRTDATGEWTELIAKEFSTRRVRRGRRGGALPRDLESRVHAVRPAAGRHARAAAQAVGGHRRGTRAHRGGAAGRHEQLSHGPLRAAHRAVEEVVGSRTRHARASRRDVDGAGAGRDERRSGVVPRARRSCARGRVPARRRRVSVERGARLRAAPHPAARRPARVAARPHASRRSCTSSSRSSTRWATSIPSCVSAPRTSSRRRASRSRALPRDDRRRA